MAADPREQLTAHLTPHGARLEVAGGRTTADLSEILSGMDFAAVLGMIGPKPASMLLAKYAADEMEERKARAYWLQECIEHAAAKGWKRPKAHMVEGLAYSTIEEHMGHFTRCSVCHGTKERVINHIPIECPGCGGVGFLEYGADLLAERICCTMLEWDHTWRERVGWARRALYQWEQDAVSRLYERLRED